MIISTKIGQTSFISEEGKRFCATVLDYNTSLATGQKGRYSLITLSQQAPNVMLAVATQGVGTAFGAGATVASALTASAFGINSGTSKYADFLVRIDIDKKIESLNISNSAAIVFHHLSYLKKNSWLIQK